MNMDTPYVYQASANLTYTDHDSADAAIAAVEAAGSGSVVQFRKEYNLPGCEPRIVLKSLALWSFEGGEWWSHAIFDGHGGRLRQEKPS